MPGWQNALLVAAGPPLLPPPLAQANRAEPSRMRAQTPIGTFIMMFASPRVRQSRASLITFEMVSDVTMADFLGAGGSSPGSGIVASAAVNIVRITSSGVPMNRSDPISLRPWWFPVFGQSCLTLRMTSSLSVRRPTSLRRLSISSAPRRG